MPNDNPSTGSVKLEITVVFKLWKETGDFKSECQTFNKSFNVKEPIYRIIEWLQDTRYGTEKAPVTGIVGESDVIIARPIPCFP